MLAVFVIDGCAPAAAPAAPVGSERCSDVDVAFARGTDQPPGFGRVGDAFLRAIIAGLPGRTVKPYAVDYPADSQQDFAPGANDMTRHITAVASACPGTRFVLGGYSQGALVVSAAIGVPVAGTVTDVLSPMLSRQVAAVVVFGNPLGARGRSIETADTPFRAQSAEFCNSNDPVCGRRGPIVGTHRSYPDTGATDQAATFAIRRVS